MVSAMKSQVGDVVVAQVETKIMNERGIVVRNREY
jgi:hypothetical protein